jgi:hypothetical protein
VPVAVTQVVRPITENDVIEALCKLMSSR